MEVAGTIIGLVSAVGVVGQVFDGCIKAYSIFTKASNLGRDSERLACKTKIEETRLQVWGREWRVLEGKFDQYLEAEHTLNGDGLKAPSYQQGLGPIAKMILEQLYETIMDLNKLQDRYGLREETPGSVDKEGYKKSKANPNNFGGSKGMKLRARWVIGDKDKFEVFLKDLQYYNDRLESLFPPTRAAMIERHWTCELLQAAGRQIEHLGVLENASKDRYPSLSAFAGLKQLRVDLDQQNLSKKALSTSELKIQHWRITPKPIFGEEKNNARCAANYQRPTDFLIGDSAFENVPVIVEWIAYDPSVDLEKRLILLNRIDSLAKMLHSASNRHPDLHTLDCAGYFDDSARSRYGMVFWTSSSWSGTTPTSLAKLIADTPTPDLDVRFKLARILATAVASCHAIDWLHKSLSPSNIIFFNETGIDASMAALTKPYLAGFDSARPEHLDEMTTAPNDDDIYRHPNSLGAFRQTYRKSFDVYSLGLILLEIGLWRGLDSIFRGRASKYTPSAMKDKIVSSLLPTLGPKTGNDFRKIVEACLAFDDMQGSEKCASPHQMMQWVLITLGEIKV